MRQEYGNVSTRENLVRRTPWVRSSGTLEIDEIVRFLGTLEAEHPRDFSTQMGHSRL
jgi:hypothetical protein